VLGILCAALIREEDTFQHNREEKTEIIAPGLVQVLPFSQAPHPQTTVISVVLRSCFTTAVMWKYCFRVREIKGVSK